MPIEEFERGRTPYQKRRLILIMGIILSVSFTIMKLFDIIDWNWFKVTAALWIPFTILTIMEVMGIKLLDESQP